jgi:hypothetical protein
MMNTDVIETSERSGTGTEFAAVTDYLRSINPVRWAGRRDYLTMTPQRLFGQLADVYGAVLACTDADPVRVATAYEHSLRFAAAAFTNLQARRQHVFGDRRIDSVFAVPLRHNGVDPIYSTDSDAFLPLFSREFGISADIQLRAILGLPPTVIETNFQGTGPGQNGVTICVPLFSTMIEDINPDHADPGQTAELLRIGSTIMARAAYLAHVQLGAKVMGLGGTLPKVSGFGASFKHHPTHDMSGLVTTTGHGGTVHLILETVRALQTTKTFGRQDSKLGVIGAAGSIGWSSVVCLHDLFDKSEIRVNDHRHEVLHDKIASYQHGRLLHQRSTVIDVLRESNIIVAAVTRPIDLDAIDPHAELDLRGKAIIDDSEPKAFRRAQVEARGGFLLNVAGQAHSGFAALRRDGHWTAGPQTPYAFGDEAGLLGDSSWGCDVERVMISSSGAHTEAITDEVTPNNVRSIGRLCAQAGVGVAPFQSFNQAVAID